MMNWVTLLVGTSRKRDCRIGQDCTTWLTVRPVWDVTKDVLGNRITCNGLWLSRSAMDHTTHIFGNFLKRTKAAYTTKSEYWKYRRQFDGCSCRMFIPTLDEGDWRAYFEKRRIFVPCFVNTHFYSTVYFLFALSFKFTALCRTFLS